MGAGYLAITMGLRQTVGLYVPSLQSTGMDIATISLAMAIGQLMWGLVQPVMGAVADRYGHLWVLIGGAVFLAIGTLIVPYWLSPFGLILTFGILAPLGSGAGSFSTLIGLSGRALPAERRSFATGVINAGGSFGQFTYASIVQGLISKLGMSGSFLWSGLSALLAVPLAVALHRLSRQTADSSNVSPAQAMPTALPCNTPAQTLKGALSHAFSERDYGLLHLGFFTCGFHVAFLVTHLKVEVVTCHGLQDYVAAVSLGLIGLFNIAGSLLAGYLGERYRMKILLAWIYGTRAVAIVAYLILPKTEWTYYVFAAVLGLTWLATVPPTAGIIGRKFGVKFLATLFGMTLVSHQIGGFFGAYLGGIVIRQSGDYQWMWYLDIALALFAALVSLPIREWQTHVTVLKPA